MWPFRIALARLRPIDFRLGVKLALVLSIFGAFIWGDYILFRRVFRAAAQIEALNPFFALGLIENFLGLVFLIALFVLFFSSLTSSIGAFFTDRDLELYHSAPSSRPSILVGRWFKTYVQGSWAVFFFLLPMFAALLVQYGKGPLFLVVSMLDLVLMMSIPISLASSVIVLLVRYFPVGRVHQIAATLAILVLTLLVVGLRMARPERLFTEISTDELTVVLAAIELPAMDRYPSGWIASSTAERVLDFRSMMPNLKLMSAAFGAFALFLLIGALTYYRAFVRARESSAPVALGSGAITLLLDWMTSRLHPQSRALFGKEVRVVTRDATQWSQLFMMIALLFLYVYNIQMMPLEGDYRAPILAYLNLGMAGFVVAAICLRFAYPSLSAEGKSFWILEGAPISIRRLLWVKYAVYLLPLLAVSLLLTVLANAILDAAGEIWIYTLGGTFFITATLVALGVGMGAMSPDFETENPVEVALSLGGLAYMALSLLYVGVMMFLFARPMQRFFFRVMFGVSEDLAWISTAAPTFVAVGVSIALIVGPLEVAGLRLAKRSH